MPDETPLLKVMKSLTGKHGILGCLVVDSGGEVVASSMPSDVDIAMISGLSTTLFSNPDVSIQRTNRGNLVQMTLRTDQGTLHFYERDKHFLVALSAKGQEINLGRLIRSIEDT